MKNIVCILLLVLLTSCGGGGGGGGSSNNNTSPEAVPSVAQFVDAPVAGLAYTCGSYSGTTNTTGQFNYSPGSSCTFKVGNVTVGSVASIPADGVVTPMDVAGVVRTATSDPNTQTIAQFLQSIGNTSGGVTTIASSVSQRLAAVSAVNLISTSGPISQAALTTLTTSAGVALVSPTVASTTLSTQIAAAGINTGLGLVTPTPTPTLNAITISSASTSIASGLTLQLTASGNYSNGSTQTMTSSVTWSSANTSVLTVSSGGLVTGVSAGTTVVNATSSGGLTASLSITVTSATLVSLSVSPTSSTVAKGLTQQMVVTGTFTDKTSKAINASSVTWSSSNVGIAVIGSNGVVQGISPGNTTITASYLGLSSLTPLTISDAVVKNISISTAGSASTAAAGNSLALTAMGTYSDNSTVNITNLVTWASSTTNASITSTSNSTLLTGRLAGTTIVSASYQSVSSNSLSITITSAALQSIAITAQTNTNAPVASQAPAGYSQNFIATGSYSDGTTQTLTTNATWTSSNPNIATVISGTGVVTGKTQSSYPSSATITATYSGVSSQASFIVLAPVVASVVVNATSTNDEVGTTENLTATATYSDGSTKDVTSLVTWTSSNGSGTINASGLLTGVSPGATNIVASYLGVTSSNKSITIINTDPLLPYQWHIKNIGTSAFSSALPVSGNDMNVMGAWALGYTGKGIKVAVVDSGLEVAHEDLSANVDVANSYNFLNGTTNPTPSIPGEDHGTQVAGIIGAVAFNGKGGRGVAYNSTLRGYNLIASGANYLANIGSALGGATYSASNDIFNESFASAYGSLPPTNSTFVAITTNVLSLRSGKGAILVQSAGNEFQSSSSGKCTNANSYHVSCGDPATDTRRDGYGPIVVGAFNSDGVKSSYSNAGTALWVSAPGGEYGVDSAYLAAQLAVAYKPAIITTSLDGCSNATSNGFSTNRLNALNSLGSNPLAANCQYTAIMNGTSSAAPNVSAVVALMLEANPSLGFRDVKYILAKTAKKIDPTYAGVSSTTLVPPSTVTLDQGWVKNAANYWFSTWYGFGAVDATAAVTMAKTYSSYLAAEKTVSSALNFIGTTIVPYGATGTTMTFNINPSFSTVEHVLLFTNLSFTSLTCNQFELTSPSGTKSILIHGANGYSSDGLNYQSSINSARLLSNAFYGESAAGNWTLKFLNFCPGVTTMIMPVDTQTLSIVGH